MFPQQGADVHGPALVEGQSNRLPHADGKRPIVGRRREVQAAGLLGRSQKNVPLHKRVGPIVPPSEGATILVFRRRRRA